VRGPGEENRPVEEKRPLGEAVVAQAVRFSP